MRQHSRRLAAWVTGLVLGLTQAVLAQVVVQLAPLPAPGGQPDLNHLVHQMAERVRHLGEDITSDMSQLPQARHLIEDTRELAEAVDAFHETLHGNPDPARVGQAFAGIEGTWNHLKAQFAQTGIASPAVVRALRHVDQLDAEIRQRLALNFPPPGPATDLNRMTHEMAERVRHLGEDIASDLGRTPQGRHLLEDLRELAAAVDAFHQTLHDIRDPNQIRQAYRGIDETWHHLKEQLSQPGVSSPAVDRAAQHVDQLDAQIHQALGLLPASPQPMSVPAAAQPASGAFSPDPTRAPALPFAPAPPVLLGTAVPGTDPRHVARAAREFARAVDDLEDTIEDAADDSPLEGEVDRLEDSVRQFRERVQRGETFEQALRDFREIELAYGRILALLSRDPVLNQDARVVSRINDVQAAFGRLQAQMSGRR